MELPSIGKRCAASDCNQLDFLPLQCKCGEVFCSEHFTVHARTCETSKYLAEGELKAIRDVFVCSRADCKERSIVPLICERCRKHFCVRHRHLVTCQEKDADALAAEKEKYAAPLRQFKEAKAAMDKQVDDKLNELKKKAKNKDTANKVQLMKIKNKATGPKTVPATNRVYFNVSYPKSLEKIAPVFVSNQWTVGRAIDAIAQELKVQNNNHKSGEKKLRLFKRMDREIISNDLSVVLCRLLEDKIIVDGESLVMEYVDDDCVKLV